MKKLFYALCCILFILSCSKDGLQSKTALLTAGTWKIIADTINPGRSINGQNHTNMFQFYDACDLDDYFSFRSDGTYELNIGPLKCLPADPQKIEGSWFFSDGDTKLNLSPYNNYLFNACDIQELTSTRMKLMWYTKEPNGTITRTHVITLAH